MLASVGDLESEGSADLAQPESLVLAVEDRLSAEVQIRLAVLQ